MAGEEEYSHYGEFQALMKKWINREVSNNYMRYCSDRGTNILKMKVNIFENF